MEEDLISSTDAHCPNCSGEIKNGERCQLCMVHDLAMCAPLHDDDLNELESLKNRESFSSGAAIFQEGSAREKIYTIVSGAVRLVKTLNDGRRCITGFAFAGDFLGFVEAGSHILTAEAITPVIVCSFDRRMIENYLRQHSEVRDRVLDMAKNALQRSYENQLILSRLSPVEKVARFLFDMIRRMENNRLRASPLTLLMNRTDIADHLGLTIETVSRCFSKLKVQGVIKLLSVNQVEIVDQTLLKQIAAITCEVE